MHLYGIIIKITMETIVAVIPTEPKSWLSNFCVRSFINGGQYRCIITTNVKTVDVYTYRCTSCKNNEECQHIEAVRKYVINELYEMAENEMIDNVRTGIVTIDIK